MNKTGTIRIDLLMADRAQRAKSPLRPVSKHNTVLDSNLFAKRGRTHGQRLAIVRNRPKNRLCEICAHLSGLLRVAAYKYVPIVEAGKVERGLGKSGDALQLVHPHHLGPGVSIKPDFVDIVHGLVHELNRADHACVRCRDGGAESAPLADLEYIAPTVGRNERN